MCERIVKLVDEVKKNHKLVSLVNLYHYYLPFEKEL